MLILPARNQILTSKESTEPGADPNSKPRGRYCSTHQCHAQLYGDPLAGRFSPKAHPATCTVDGCDRPYRSRGMCRRHYEQARRLEVKRAER